MTNVHKRVIMGFLYIIIINIGYFLLYQDGIILKIMGSILGPCIVGYIMGWEYDIYKGD